MDRVEYIKETARRPDVAAAKPNRKAVTDLAARIVTQGFSGPQEAVEFVESLESKPIDRIVMHDAAGNDISLRTLKWAIKYRWGVKI